MIFVSIGTNEQPFDRLVRWAAALEVEEPLLVQYGSSAAGRRDDGWRDYLTFDEMAEAMGAARVVVVHAGVGSVLLARQCGKSPVVVPRRVGLGEAVDDHQLPFARRLAAAGLVRLVEDEAGLHGAVQAHELHETSAPGHDSGHDLAQELRTYLNQMVMT